jgi:hypothetical protein
MVTPTHQETAMHLRAFIAIMLVLPLSPGCRRQQSSDSETGGVDTTENLAGAPAPAVTDTATTAGDFSFEQRQEFAGSIRQQLADLDRDIRDLASQAKSKGGAVSDRALANIRASRRAVDGSLRRIDAATSADWEQVKDGVNRAVENLNESIEAAQPK